MLQNNTGVNRWQHVFVAAGNGLQVTSFNDNNVARLIEAVFGVSGLTGCDDKLSYDTTLEHIRATHLLLLPNKLRQYFDNDVEPLLRANMESGRADGRTTRDGHAT